MGADREATVDSGGVMLNPLPPLNEYLIYTVTVSGAQPKFVLVDDDSKKVLLKSDGAPQKTYTRRWPSAAELGSINAGDFYKHVLGMSFLKAVKYRFVVEHYDSEDELLEVLADIVWSSDTPDTESFEPFSVDVPEEL